MSYNNLTSSFSSFSSGTINENEIIGRGTRANSKVYLHVSPRVDQEHFQAEIPFIYHGPFPDEGLSLYSFPLLTFFFLSFPSIF